MTNFETIEVEKEAIGTQEKAADLEPTIDDIVVGVGKLCEIFSVSEQYLGRLVGQDILRRTGRGQYPLTENVSRYVAHLRSRRGLVETDDDVDNAYERAMLARSQREKIDVEIAERRRQLIPFETAELAFGDLIAQARTKLLALPSRAAPLVAGDSPEGAFALLTSLVDEILSDLSQSPDILKPEESYDLSA